MRHRHAAALCSLAAFAPPALADGTATWVWDVTTQDGDAVVEPGETATVTLSVDMDPDVSFPDGPVLGFASSEFDTLGGANADQGSILTWDVLGDLDFIGDQTTTDGVSLFGTVAVQAIGNDNFDPSDPIGILEFVWSPDAPGTYEVAYATSTNSMMIWEGTLEKNDFVPWDVNEALIEFQVIPSPGGILAFLLGAAICGNRPRRTLHAGASQTESRRRDLPGIHAPV